MWRVNPSAKICEKGEGEWCGVLLANPVLVSTFVIMGRPSEREGTRLELDL